MKNKTSKTKKKKTFKEAVAATPNVRHCFREGKQAILNSERNKVELTDSRKCGGSVFIDQCLINQNIEPNANRWDYAIDYNGEVYFFEVHTANTKQVSTVLKKLDWLKNWLLYEAQEINVLKANAPFYWVQSNGYHILPNSPQERLVNQKGIRPISKLVLK